MLAARHPIGSWVGPRHPPPPMLNKSKGSRRHNSQRHSRRASRESHRGPENGRSWAKLGLSSQEVVRNDERNLTDLYGRLDPLADDRRVIASPRYSESEGDREPLGQFLDRRRYRHHVQSDQSTPDPHFNPLSQRQLQPNVSGSEFPSTAQTRAARPLRRRPHQQVLSACSNCKKDHLSCDTSRPCNRCVSTNKQVR